MNCFPGRRPAGAEVGPAEPVSCLCSRSMNPPSSVRADRGQSGVCNGIQTIGAEVRPATVQPRST